MPEMVLCGSGLDRDLRVRQRVGQALRKPDLKSPLARSWLSANVGTGKTVAFGALNQSRNFSCARRSAILIGYVS